MVDDTFKKFTNFYVEATQVLEKNREDYSVSLQPIIKALVDFNSLLCRDYQNLPWIGEFFDKNSDTIQKCFINMHFIFCDEKRDIDLRLLCGQSIYNLFKEIPKYEMKLIVSPIVPGLLNNFSEAAIDKGSNTNSDIVFYCLNLIESVVITTYDEWIDTKGSQFEVILNKIISNLTTHKSKNVRLKIVTMLKKFNETFKIKFQPIKIMLIENNMELEKSSFIRHLTKELNTSLDKPSLSNLSSTTKNQIDISRVLIRIHNLIVILGPEYLSTILSVSTKLLDTIASILTVNIDKVSIVTEKKNDSLQSSLQFFNLIELKNNVRNDLILNICNMER
uniref:Riboflavin kinase n=1 Tax=Strongyloides stercoralis TaxID=6248 RepID=A0AAF5CS08_STRER